MELARVATLGAADGRQSWGARSIPSDFNAVYRHSQDDAMFDRRILISSLIISSIRLSHMIYAADPPKASMRGP